MVWWQDAFAAPYDLVYAHRGDAAAAVEVAGILPRLQMCPGPILDACCGNGRHAAAMRSAGLDVYGFDYSGDLLALAARRNECRGRLWRGDVRQPGVAPGWGAITLFFTAFGYFDDRTNALVLRRLGGLLAQKGVMMVDLPNTDRVRGSLVPSSERVLADGSELQEQRWLADGRVRKRVCWKRTDGSQRVWEEDVRLYSTEEFESLVADAGLRVDGRWNSLRGPDMDDQRWVWWLV